MGGLSKAGVEELQKSGVMTAAAQQHHSNLKLFKVGGSRGAADRQCVCVEMGEMAVFAHT